MGASGALRAPDRAAPGSASLRSAPSGGLPLRIPSARNPTASGADDGAGRPASARWRAIRPAGRSRRGVRWGIDVGPEV